MQNVGIWDRIIRFILVLVFLAAGSFLVDGWARLVLYVLALMMTVTFTMGFCFLYKFLDISTIRRKQE